MTDDAIKDLPEWRQVINGIAEHNSYHCTDEPDSLPTHAIMECPDIPAALMALARRCIKLGEQRVKCVQCKGNGRVEMLEHCPVCDGSGTRRMVDILYSALQHCIDDADGESLKQAQEATALYLAHEGERMTERQP